ncbi:CATRA conflict system CASPASE/TPR repeat-associated protein [Nonomuraea sp. NPDC050790]|uniref:CATRA conflict system CASPASE/TPR repeat-associated protein n=1 Tax=Nonomuraea sp. NPDC050790 TaxID=3364371 RepID=UPI0037A0B761
MRILDQQLVIHLFAPTDGPDADAAFRALRDLWRGCQDLFGMHDAVDATGLPRSLPETLSALGGVEPEVALAVQERRDTECQAILRRHHDVLALSVMLAAPSPGGWKDLDARWNALAYGRTAPMIGEARLYLAKHDGVPSGAELADLLPPSFCVEYDWSHGVTEDGRTVVWEPSASPEERQERRLVLAFTAEAADAAGDWAWSRGDTAIPALARYLLHAAKLRYELRVWQRDGHTGDLRTAIASMAGEAGRPDGQQAEHLRINALLMSTDLRELHHTVSISADNLTRIVARPELLAPGGPFADDLDLAQWFLTRLDDEIAYLAASADRAGHLASMSGTATRPEAPSDDITRNVFVVHGRDGQARRAVFDLLRALDLRPLEWEQLVAETGSAAPFLGEVIAHAVKRAQAVVVLLTPDDVVRLHPDLHTSREDEAETRFAMQPRPNVLLELGMALSAFPDRTIIVTVGTLRPIADIGGRNYVRIDDSHDYLHKIALRLERAGCRVSQVGQDWLSSARFDALDAHTRTP